MSIEQSQEYRGNGNHEWELVADGGEAHQTVRRRVPGGWLYTVTAVHEPAINTVFVPMPDVVKHKV